MKLVASLLDVVAQSAGGIVNLVLRVIDFDKLNAGLKWTEPLGSIAMGPNVQRGRFAGPYHSPNRSMRSAVEPASAKRNFDPLATALQPYGLLKPWGWGVRIRFAPEDTSCANHCFAIADWMLLDTQLAQSNQIVVANPMMRSGWFGAERYHAAESVASLVSNVQGAKMAFLGIDLDLHEFICQRSVGLADRCPLA